jgi:transposase
VPKPFPPESGVTSSPWPQGEASLSQVARDFGISESCLQRWLEIADRDDGLTPPTSGDRGGGKNDFVELLEQENEILQRATAYFAATSSQNDLPAGP